MQAWLESIAGPDYASALMWTIFALIGLLVLLILIRIVRGLTFGTFVAGGRNRKARLAVMDATAVDSHRRLVLVRRDDVEHLILIGGPTDVVVEQNIRLLAPSRRPAEEAPAPQPQYAPAAAPIAAERPRPQPESAPPRPAPQPVPAALRQPAPAPQPVQPRAHAPAVPSQPAPPRQPFSPEPRHSPPPQPQRAALSPSATLSQQPRTSPTLAQPAPSAAETASASTASASTPRKQDIDDALLEELEVTLERENRTAAPASTGNKVAPPVERTLDEEMNKLLGDLANRR